MMLLLQHQLRPINGSDFPKCKMLRRFDDRRRAEELLNDPIMIAGSDRIELTGRLMPSRSKGGECRKHPKARRIARDRLRRLNEQLIRQRCRILADWMEHNGTTPRRWIPFTIHLTKYGPSKMEM
jgi:hypothetical protein